MPKATTKPKEAVNDVAGNAQELDSDEKPAAKHGADLEGMPFLQDPLTWFNIAPSSLRQAQSSFQVAVLERLPTLVNTIQEIERTEIEVRRTRKKINKLGRSRENDGHATM